MLTVKKPNLSNILKMSTCVFSKPLPPSFNIINVLIKTNGCPYDKQKNKSGNIEMTTISKMNQKCYLSNSCLIKWLRYQRVISLKIQIGDTNQRNKWANTDPWIYRRWDQVPRRSKHPLLIDHTRCEPSSMIMNAELSAVKVSVSSTA
jgi:hypothetical protein